MKRLSSWSNMLFFHSVYFVFTSVAKTCKAYHNHVLIGVILYVLLPIPFIIYQSPHFFIIFQRADDEKIYEGAYPPLSKKRTRWMITYEAFLDHSCDLNCYLHLRYFWVKEDELWVCILKTSSLEKKIVYNDKVLWLSFTQ